MSRVFFFGVLTGRGAGHYLHTPDGEIVGREKAILPVALHRLDGVWCAPVPRTTEEVWYSTSGYDTEGQGYIHYVDGWTVISWWDRSEDSRGNCCAAFLIEGRHTWDNALNAASAAFPRELLRMTSNYPVRLAGADLAADSDEASACAFLDAFHALHPNVQDLVRPRIARARP